MNYGRKDIGCSDVEPGGSECVILENKAGRHNSHVEPR